jgi:hypothetical protein
VYEKITVDLHLFIIFFPFFAERSVWVINLNIKLEDNEVVHGKILHCYSWMVIAHAIANKLLGWEGTLTHIHRCWVESWLAVKRSTAKTLTSRAARISIRLKYK